MNFKTKSFCVLATTLVGTAALAQTATLEAAPLSASPAEPASTVIFNVGVVNDYRFRGVSQTSFKPALQGGVDFTHKSGLYLGAAASNINWIKDYVGASEGSLEVDLYGGFKGEISQGLNFDVGAITYQYPNNTADRVLVNANTTEIYGALTFGIVTVKYSQATGNFIANPNSSGSSYMEAAAAFDLGGGFLLTPHVGRQTVTNQSGNGDYTDFSLTLGKDFGNGLTASLSAMTTDAKDAFYKVGTFDNLAKNAVTVGVKYTF